MFRTRKQTCMQNLELFWQCSISPKFASVVLALGSSIGVFLENQPQPPVCPTGLKCSSSFVIIVISVGFLNNFLIPRFFGQQRLTTREKSPNCNSMCDENGLQSTLGESGATWQQQNQNGLSIWMDWLGIVYGLNKSSWNFPLTCTN
jgi:hypothetical protein